MRRLTLPLLTLSALLITAGGALHLRDWSRTYRAVPWEVPGAWVVRVGFPVNAASSILVAAGLVAAATMLRRFSGVIVTTAIAFQGASLVALIVSRRGSVFGWTEPGWTTNTRQIAAVEIAALIALAASLAVRGHQRGGTRDRDLELAIAYSTAATVSAPFSVSAPGQVSMQPRPSVSCRTPCSTTTEC